MCFDRRRGGVERESQKGALGRVEYAIGLGETLIQLSDGRRCYRVERFGGAAGFLAFPGSSKIFELLHAEHQRPQQQEMQERLHGRYQIGEVQARSCTAFG